MLVIENLTVEYNGAMGVSKITLAVERKKVVALIGANGAGKSTILKAVSGLVHVKSGRIIFFGRDITGLPPKLIVKLGIAHVPENRRLFPFLSVKENLILGAYVRSDSKGIENDMEEVLSLFPRLKEKLYQKAGTLSGGEQQMVAIGRALMARPKLLLMDEPSLGLAPLVIESLTEKIKAIVETRGISVLLAEQNASLVMETADYCYVLEAGRIVLEGVSRYIMATEEWKRAFLG